MTPCICPAVSVLAVSDSTGIRVPSVSTMRAFMALAEKYMDHLETLDTDRRLKHALLQLCYQHVIAIMQQRLAAQSSPAIANPRCAQVRTILPSISTYNCLVGKPSANDRTHFHVAPSHRGSPL